MRRLIVFMVLFSSISIRAFGQPVYPSTDFVGVADSVQVSTALVALDSMDYGFTGQDVQWDFSWLPVDNQAWRVYQDPNDAGYKNSWCFLNGAFLNCNQAFNDHVNRATDFLDFEIAGFILENPVVHYELTASTFEEKFVGAIINLGETPIPGTIDLQDVDTVYSFPLEFGQLHRSSRRFVADLASFGVDAYFISESERTSEIDGWGALGTPYRDYDQVLRMRTLVQGVDSASFDTIVVDFDYQRVTYQWFAPGYPLPVLQLSGLIIDGEEIINQVEFIDSARCLTPDALFAFLPPDPVLDPLTESVSINFTNLSTAYNAVSWDFGDGTFSDDISPSRVFTCGDPREVTLVATNTNCMPAETDTFSLMVVPDASGTPIAQNRVTESDRILQAQLEGVQYQWLLCEENTLEAIEGATADTFALPQGGGVFALSVETPNGCVDTSDCILYDASVHAERIQPGLVEIFPNPVRDEIILRSSRDHELLNAELYAIDGKLKGQWNLKNRTFTRIPVQAAPGTYVLKVITGRGVHTQMITVSK